MNKNILTAYLFASVLLFSSCIGKRKIARLNQSIEGQKSIEKKFDSLLVSLNNFRGEKTALGELDDSSSVAIKRILDKERTESKRRTDSLSEIQYNISSKRVKVREYKNMFTIITAGPSIISQKMETVGFVDLLLNQQTFIKFNTATFFPPGGYKITPEKLPDAKIVFAPIVDSLISFVKRFPKFALSSSIISSGYADGQGFSPGELVDMLNKNLGKTDATKEEMNLELSRLRAEEIVGVLTEIFKEKVQNLPPSASLNTKFFKTGKGEEFPNKKIKDYQVDDERRRIVVIYWNALPEVK